MPHVVFIFGLCLSLLGVGMGYDTISHRLGVSMTPAQQCISHGYQGTCNGQSLMSPSICSGVRCAKKVNGPRPHYSAVSISTVDGTKCGYSHVCVWGSCKSISLSKCVSPYGSTASFPCT